MVFLGGSEFTWHLRDLKMVTKWPGWTYLNLEILMGQLQCLNVAQEGCGGCVCNTNKIIGKKEKMFSSQPTTQLCSTKCPKPQWKMHSWKTQFWEFQMLYRIDSNDQIVCADSKNMCIIGIGYLLCHQVTWNDIRCQSLIIIFWI